jgi:cell fate regulator YaaT (PSP1 superfamily)
LVTYGKPRFLGIVSLNDEDYDSIKKERLIVAVSHRGEELAEVVGAITAEQEIEYRSLKTVSEHGEGPVRGGDPVVTDIEFVRAPTERDLEEHEEEEARGFETLQTAQEMVEWHKLRIKLIDSEMLPGGKKLFFYFTADQRVDFRMLVKDLARRFKTRIELRQMGVRDEARIIKGISSCGLPCCCGYWLNRFSPIGVKMVKEQNIALNPAKISGICGRLMCCMSFEHKTYKNLWAGLPGPGSKIKTPAGNYIVLAIDVAREAVRCHRPAGGDLLVPISLFAEFREAVTRGEEWEVPEDAVSDFDKRKMACAECGKRLPFENFDFSSFEKKKPQARKAGADDEQAREGGEARKRKRRGRYNARGPECVSAGKPIAGPKPQEPAPNEARKQRTEGAKDEGAMRHKRSKRPIHPRLVPAECAEARGDR